MKRLSMLDFKLCPKCAAHMIFISNILELSHFKKSYTVMCTNCGHTGKEGKDIEEAKEKWNQMK